MNDPWAVDPPKITAHQVSRIVGLIANYTAAEGAALIDTLTRHVVGTCSWCNQVGTHSRNCPTQGNRHD